jgi:hypothetical protein
MLDIVLPIYLLTHRQRGVCIHPVWNRIVHYFRLPRFLFRFGFFLPETLFLVELLLASTA